MPENTTKIAINLLGWHSDFDTICLAIDSVLKQSRQDFILYYSENDSKEKTILPEIRDKYRANPKVKTIDNLENLGYAGGHNKFFAEAETELVMVLNPDAELDQDFLEKIIPVFDNPQVGMATGKMVKPMPNAKGQKILDGTGIIVFKNRRGRERGQMEVDNGQYDRDGEVFGVSGTASVYRRSALERVKIDADYFDHDFFAYWEDLDLSWRLRLVGYIAWYKYDAVIFHQRVAGSHPGGYKDLKGFVKHHRQLSLNVRRWNWRNHLFCIIKNDFGYPLRRDFIRILGREVLMAGYITIFEPKTWGILPNFFNLLPKILTKRRIIQRRRLVNSDQAAKWFI